MTIEKLGLLPPYTVFSCVQSLTSQVPHFFVNCFHLLLPVGTLQLLLYTPFLQFLPIGIENILSCGGDH